MDFGYDEYYIGKSEKFSSIDIFSLLLRS